MPSRRRHTGEPQVYFETLLAQFDIIVDLGGPLLQVIVAPGVPHVDVESSLMY